MTIEERAKKSAMEFAGWNDTLNSGFEAGYVLGATEQKQIDDEQYRKDMTYIVAKKQEWIDKACEWLLERLQFGCHPCSGSTLVLEFRKAMEG